MKTSTIDSVRRAPTRAQLLFAAAALVSLALSGLLWVQDRTSEALFVGLWVPSILSFGCLMLHGRR